MEDKNDSDGRAFYGNRYVRMSDTNSPPSNTVDSGSKVQHKHRTQFSKTNYMEAYRFRV